MLEHSVNIQADLLGEYATTVLTLVLPTPWCHSQMDMAVMEVKLALSAEHLITLVTLVLLPDPSVVPCTTSSSSQLLLVFALPCLNQFCKERQPSNTGWRGHRQVGSGSLYRVHISSEKNTLFGKQKLFL